MLRTSEKHGMMFTDIFTLEVYNRLKNGESFRMNLETMQLEEIPEAVTIPQYDVVVYGIHNTKQGKAVVIHDFLDIIFPYDWLSMGYYELVNQIQNDLKENKNK